MPAYVMLTVSRVVTYDACFAQTTIVAPKVAATPISIKAATCNTRSEGVGAVLCWSPCLWASVNPHSSTSPIRCVSTFGILPNLDTRFRFGLPSTVQYMLIILPFDRGSEPLRTTLPAICIACSICFGDLGADQPRWQKSACISQGFPLFRTDNRAIRELLSFWYRESASVSRFYRGIRTSVGRGASA
jgi:hypothetical protein